MGSLYSQSPRILLPSLLRSQEVLLGDVVGAALPFLKRIGAFATLNGPVFMFELTDRDIR